MDYEITLDIINIIKTINNGVLYVEENNKLPFFILGFIKNGANTIDKISKELKTLDETRVKFLLYDYEKNYKIIQKIQNESYEITKLGYKFLNEKKIYEPKYGTIIVKEINLTKKNKKDERYKIEKCLGIEIDENNGDKIQEITHDTYMEIISGNKEDELYNKKVLVIGEGQEESEVIKALVKNDEIYIKGKHDFMSKILDKEFKYDKEQTLKEILKKKNLWSDKDEKFIPNIEMLKDKTFIIDNNRYTYYIDENRKISNFQIAPDENTSCFWFLHKLATKVKDYINKEELERIIIEINDNLSRNFYLYKKYEYNKNNMEILLQDIINHEKYELFRYINTLVNLPIDGI